MGNATPGPLWKRLAWFAGLWAGGVAAVAAIALLLRLWIG
jgi:hypothetical protein